MNHKKRTIQYTKRDCTPYIEYWVISDDNQITTCPPQKWHHVDLQDNTTPETLAKCAAMRYKAKQKQFNKQVEDNAWIRSNPPPSGTDRHVHLCNHLGIKI